MVFILVPFRSTCKFFSGKIIYSYFEDKNRSIECSFSAGLVGDVLLVLNIFSLKRHVNIALTVVLLTLLSPDRLTPTVRFSLCLPSRLTTSVCSAVLSVVFLALPFLCPPSALPLFCAFSRILILIYKSGPLSFIPPCPRPQDPVTCRSMFCCPPMSVCHLPFVLSWLIHFL